MELKQAPNPQPAQPLALPLAEPSKPERVFPHGHVTAGSTTAAIVSIAFAFFQGHGVSGSLETHAHEISTKLDKQGEAIAETAKAVTGMQATLVRLEERMSASDRDASQFRADLRDALSEIHALDRATAKAEARLDEHDRRFQQQERK